MAKRKSTKKITLCALLSALGVVILYIGGLIEVLDISMAVIASFTCVVAVIELGGSAPWFVWGATSVLSLIIIPQKLSALMYLVFFGFYPIIKEKLERIKNIPLLWLIKVVIFNAAIFAVTAISKWFFMIEESIFVFEIIFFALANLTLILYDIAMTRVISFYIIRLRKRLRIDKL